MGELSAANTGTGNNKAVAIRVILCCASAAASGFFRKCAIGVVVTLLVIWQTPLKAIFYTGADLAIDGQFPDPAIVTEVLQAARTKWRNK